MKRILLGILSNILMVVVPLLGKPYLMLDGKIIFIVTGGIFMWLTQPPVSAKETSEKKESDRFTVVLILAMSVLSVWVPVIHWAYFSEHQHGYDVFTFIGFAMIVIGISFRAWSVSTLGKYFTATVQISEDHRLVTNGPYGLARHPSYTGAFLAITAGGPILHSLPGFIIACAAMGYAYFVRIRIEEKELVARFGDEYKTYKTRTKMIIPYVW